MSLLPEDAAGGCRLVEVEAVGSPKAVGVVGVKQMVYN